MREEDQSMTDERIVEVVEIAAEYAAEVDAQGRYPHEAMDALRQHGLLNLLIPIEAGGGGGTLAQFVQLVRQLGCACGSTAYCYAMHVGACYTLAMQRDEPRLARKSLALCQSGELCTIAVSPFRGPSGVVEPVQIRRIDGGYELSGRKAWCTGAVAAGAVLVFVTPASDDTAPSLAPLLLWVDTPHTSGLTIEPTWDAVGIRGSRSDTLVFDRAVIPASSLIGEEGKGDLSLSMTDAPTLLGLAAASLGCGEGALRAGVQAMRGRLRPAPVPPPVALEIAAAEMQVRAAAATLQEAALAATESAPAARMAILTAKRLCNLTAIAAADAGMAAGGASAYQRGSALERHWRDAHAGRLMVPTPEECATLVARDMLGWS